MSKDRLAPGYHCEEEEEPMTQTPPDCSDCVGGAGCCHAPTQTLPTTSAERKDVPLARGVLDYFPAALAAVAELSRAGNEKHNPGQELHHARGKSTDHADCILRHLVDRGTEDPEDGIRHSVKVAWRALALLQEELEAEAGAPLPRAERLPGWDIPAAPTQMIDTTGEPVVVVKGFDGFAEALAQAQHGRPLYTVKPVS